MDNTNARPFRFFDLPAELRLMVYSFLPSRRHHKVVVEMFVHEVPMYMVLSEPIAPLHLACRMVHKEMVPALKSVMGKSAVPRIIAYTNDYEYPGLLQIALREVLSYIDLGRSARRSTASELRERYNVGNSFAFLGAPGFGKLTQKPCFNFRIWRIDIWERTVLEASILRSPGAALRGEIGLVLEIAWTSTASATMYQRWYTTPTFRKTERRQT
jgi:hypothetical protein